jgi:hypothetical protein
LNAFIATIPYLKTNEYFSKGPSERDIKTLPDEDPLSYVSMRTQFVIELENRKPTYYPWLRDNNYVPVFDTDGSTAFKDSLDAEEAQFEPDFAS